MRLRGYQLTRFADDWVISCKSAAEARAAMEAAGRILKQLGVGLHPQKTRIVHVRDGFEFLGYKIKLGQRKLDLPDSQIRSQVRRGALYAYPKEKSIRRFMDRVRQRTQRRIPPKTKDLIAELNPLLRGWASITNAPRFASSSTDLMAGLCDGSGPIGTSVGETAAGNGCPRRRFTASTGVLT
jgi:hypothetical protein